jgi:hypothetical protein
MNQQAVRPNNNFFEAVRDFAAETASLTDAEKEDRSLANLTSQHGWKVFKARVDSIVSHLKDGSKGVKESESQTMCLHRKLATEAIEDVLKGLISMVEETAKYYDSEDDK